jgi:hypothetical protein
MTSCRRSGTNWKIGAAERHNTARRASLYRISCDTREAAMPNRQRSARSLLAAAVLALAGCADSATIYSENYLPIYYPGEHAAAGTSLAVYVFGSPFGEPIDRFGGEVIDAMQGWAFAYSKTRFAPPAQTPPSTYRAVMVFDPTAFAPSICASPLTRAETSSRMPAAPSGFALPPAGPAGAVPAGGRVPLVAALCRGDTAMAWANGTVPAGTGPESPAFRHGVGQFTAALFPSQNPEYINGDSSLD